LVEYGLPSTSAFSFFFIGINQSSAAAVQATTVFPLAFAVTSAYLFFYAFFAQKGFIRGICISLFIWFAVSGLIVASGFNDFALALVGGAVISSLTYYFFVKMLKLENPKSDKKTLHDSRDRVSRFRCWRFGCVISAFKSNRWSSVRRYSSGVSSGFHFNLNNIESKQRNGVLACHH
jgi:hypothetical protein